MRAKIALLLSASLLTGAIAATAQPLPCTSVAAEVRERVREAGACRDATPEDVAPSAPSSAVTMKLSDGTVVRIPSEISSTINDGRKRAATNETAKPKGAPRASAQSKPDASAGPALQKLNVPDVIGRSYVGAGNALAEFKVRRIETASAAPAGEVLAQEPAPDTLALPGSTISLRVSDGSLASVADKTSVTEPATAAAPPSAPAPAPAADPAPATTTTAAPAAEPTVPPAPRVRFPIALSENAALILGAGVLLGLLLGALLMRQWLLRRKRLADEDAAPPTLYQRQQPVDTGTGGVQTEAAPEFRFAARLYPGETTIVLVPRPDGEEVAIEQSSDQHA
jgi:PASTA domain